MRAARGRALRRAGAVALLLLVPAAGARAQATDSARAGHHPMDHAAHGAPERGSGEMIVPMLTNPMLSALLGVRPDITPFLPGAGLDPESIPRAVPREVEEVADGDTLVLEAGHVRRTVRGREFVMYGFNGQYPGPLIRVDQASTIHVRFDNRIELPSTIHWHGVRLENPFDGVPDVTQEPVAPGESFWYRVRLPDAGVYWYHPHVQEYVQQDLGLYGNLHVRSTREGYENPVDREEFLVLDDLLVAGDSLVPWGAERANFAIMGRFGNVVLVNGEERYRLEARPGEVVRFYLTNVSNTRTFNLSFGGAPTKLVGADLSRFEREMRVANVVIAPAQRYVVEVRFPEAAEWPLLNRIQAVNHMRGEFYAALDTLGAVAVGGEPADPGRPAAAAFDSLRADAALARELERFRPDFDRPPDRELLLTVDIRNLPIPLMQFMSIDTVYRPPVEFTDAMPNMNWISTSREVRWVLWDTGTGRENMDIGWEFRVGDVVKIRLRNDPDALHPMNHPIHIHGQRFLVLQKDGLENRNLVWKDTVLVPVGSTVDILLELSNPGEWMAHCHIAEHLDAGMMTVVSVAGSAPSF